MCSQRDLTYCPCSYWHLALQVWMNWKQRKGG